MGVKAARIWMELENSNIQAPKAQNCHNINGVSGQVAVLGHASDPMFFWKIKMGHRTLPLLTMAVLAIAAGLPSATARPAERRSDYTVSLIGLPIASLSFVASLDDREYRISGTMHSSALVDIIGKARGSVEVDGRIGTEQLEARRFVVDYTYGKESHKTEMQLLNGDVKSAVSTPATRRRPANWVPVTEEHKLSVIDPLSGMIIPEDSKVCPRNLPLFDGESRIDLQLEVKGMRPFSTRGFSGEAIVCSIRFIPKAGYRKGHSSIEYLRRLTDMEVWFARYPAGGFYAPVYVRVPTTIGPVTVAATRFGG